MTSDQSAGPPDAVAEIMELAMNLAGENAGSAIMTLTFGSSDALIERRDTAYAALEAAVTRLVAERDEAVAEDDDLVRCRCWQCDSCGYVAPACRLMRSGGLPSFITCGICDGAGWIMRPRRDVHSDQILSGPTP